MSWYQLSFWMFDELLSNLDENKLEAEILELLDSNNLDGIFISTSKGTHTAASISHSKLLQDKV